MICALDLYCKAKTWKTFNSQIVSQSCPCSFFDTMHLLNLFFSGFNINLPGCPFKVNSSISHLFTQLLKQWPCPFFFFFYLCCRSDFVLKYQSLFLTFTALKPFIFRFYQEVLITLDVVSFFIHANSKVLVKSQIIPRVVSSSALSWFSLLYRTVIFHSLIYFQRLEFMF